MKFNKVLIYLCILAVLGAYVYVVEIRQKEKTLVQEEQASRVVNLKKDDVVSVELQSQGAARIELKKPAGQWVLVEPVKTKGDDGEIDTLLHSIVTGKREKVVKDKDVDWAEYGLDKPSLVAALGTNDGVTRLAFGATNAAKTSYYVRVNDNPELLLVTDAFRNAVNKTTFNLRDKSIGSIATSDVDRLKIAREGTEIQLRREAPEKWLMIEPQEMKVKKSLAETMVRTLSTLRARDILDTPSVNPEEYGFNKPSFVANLASKDREETLIVGKPAGEGKGSEHYARINGQNTVYVIDGKVLLSLKTDPASLQDRSLFSFEPQDIDKLTVTLDGTTWEAVRDKDKKWRLEKPQEKKDIESWSVTRLLWDVKDLEWKSKETIKADEVSRFHLDKPALVVALVPKDGKPRIEFKAGWEEKNQTPASNTSDAPPKEAAAKPETSAEPKEGVSPDKAKEASAQISDEVPTAVYAVLEPQEEPGTVFVLDGSFLKRLRQDLKDLSTQEK